MRTSPTLVCDGLWGLSDSVTATWALTRVQTCLLHLIRNTFRYSSRKDWDGLGKALRPVYTAPLRSGRGGAVR